MTLVTFKVNPGFLHGPQIRPLLENRVFQQSHYDYERLYAGFQKPATHPGARTINNGAQAERRIRSAIPPQTQRLIPDRP